MLSESWEMAQTSQGDALICQDQHGTNMEVQMSITLALHILFGVGLTKKQHGSKIPIGSH